MDMGPGHFVTV